MSYKGIIFDLDGTLLNTLEDLSDAANKALESFGLPPFPYDQYKIFIGGGINGLIGSINPEKTQTGSLFHGLKEKFNTEYSIAWANKSHLYEGIPPLLDTLAKDKIPMGILSNKPHNFTTKCVEHFLSPWPFDPIQGAVPNAPVKPDPGLAIEIAQKWGLMQEEILFAGDTKTDMQTALNSGMASVGVTWGFREEEELRAYKASYIIHTPGELIPIIK